MYRLKRKGARRAAGEQGDERSSLKVREGKSLSRVRLFATPRTAAYEARPSMGFARP